MTNVLTKQEAKKTNYIFLSKKINYVKYSIDNYQPTTTYVIVKLRQGGTAFSGVLINKL